jgi:hypothetical protein
MPLVAVVHVDRVAGVFGVVEDDDAGALWTTVWANVNVGAHNVADLSCEGLEESCDAQRLLRNWRQRSNEGVHLLAWRNRSFRSCQPTVNGSYERVSINGSSHVRWIMSYVRDVELATAATSAADHAAAVGSAAVVATRHAAVTSESSAAVWSRETRFSFTILTRGCC